MPSLSPGTPGAKEAYGISIIREDFSICIPPKAFQRYQLANNDLVLLTSTRIEEPGLAILNYHKAYKSVFKKIIDKIELTDSPIWEKSRPYVLTKVKNSKVFLNKAILDAFNLKPRDRLLVIKSTTVSMCYSPVEVWKRKFIKRGFTEAIENLSKLEIF